MALCAHLAQPLTGKAAAHSRPAAFTSGWTSKATKSYIAPRIHRDASVLCHASGSSTSLVPDLKVVALPNKEYHASPLSQPAPETYAIIEVGGQQLFVEPGKWYSVNRLKAEEGSTVKFGRVLMYKGMDGVQFGTPYLGEVTVEGEVKEHFKGDKVIVYKMKPKKHYRRKNGHRQPLTKFLITKIEAGPAQMPAVTADEIKAAAARAPEGQREAAEKVLSGDDAAAAVRLAIKLK